MSNFLRDLVRTRAGDRCEYCHLPQHALPFAPFHVEHIIARQHGGSDHPDNLAFACDRCNAFKGPNLSTVNPDTQQTLLLFHPRTQSWNDHFLQRDYEIVGITDVGRATVRLLNMNAPRRVQLRQSLQIRLD